MPAEPTTNLTLTHRKDDSWTAQITLRSWSKSELDDLAMILEGNSFTDDRINELGVMLQRSLYIVSKQ